MRGPIHGGGRVTAAAPCEARLRAVPWEALAAVAADLEAPLARILAGSPADATLAAFLRARPGLDAPARAATAEALLGVGLWRRRLRAQLAAGPLLPLPRGAGERARVRGPGMHDPDPSPRLLLAALVRDLGGRDAAVAEALAALPAGALPPPRPPPADLADRWSLPDWLADAIREAAPGGGAEADALAAALDHPGPVVLRANLLRTTPAALAARLSAEGVTTRPGALAPAALVVTSPRPNVLGLAAHREGLIEVQDEGSQLLGEAVGARAGDAVLDACAGAGGKTLLLAAAVAPGGRVHAADPDAERLRRLAVRAARAGASALVVVHGAWRERRGSRVRLPRSESGGAGGAVPPATRLPDGLAVDRALVDAPCSELGALRRGPDLRWRMDPAAFAPLPALQLRILEGALRHVRPGGVLVYATCTFRREEDEDVALALEAAHPALERVPPPVPAEVLTPDGFLRTWPHRHGTDAFFAACWRVR